MVRVTDSTNQPRYCDECEDWIWEPFLKPRMYICSVCGKHVCYSCAFRRGLQVHFCRECYYNTDGV